MVIHICTKFHENIPDRIKVIEWTQFSYEKIPKGYYSIKKTEGGVTVLIVCTSSDGRLYLYKLS